jgi:hypothetical protein
MRLEIGLPGTAGGSVRQGGASRKKNRPGERGGEVRLVF